MSNPSNIYDALSDEQLMQLFQAERNTILYQVIYKRYFRFLCKYIHWYGNPSAHAEDIAQNVLIKLYNNPTLFDTNRNLKVWLIVAVKNQLKNELRNKSIRNEHLSIIKQRSDNTTEEDIDITAKTKRIQESIKQLSEDHREVIALKYSNNLTIKEISAILNCSEGTIKSRLFYAIKKMKAHVLSETNKS